MEYKCSIKKTKQKQPSKQQKQKAKIKKAQVKWKFMTNMELFTGVYFTYSLFIFGSVL